MTLESSRNVILKIYSTNNCVKKTQNAQFVHDALVARKKIYRYRTVIPYQFELDETRISRTDDSESFINFSSNDYLGLSKHPELIKASQQAAQTSGVGSTASRLITGTYQLFDQLEQELAQFTRREASLVFNSGYQANSSLFKALTTRHSVILLDKLAHNSLLNGAISSRAKTIRFAHNDVNDLEQLLQKYSETADRIWVCTESIFSMDGDRAPIAKINEMAKSYGAYTYIDEAHSIGLYGKDGGGLALELPDVDILLGTFGKAFGSFGSFVACSRQMREYLINYCEGFIYTTALPPAVIAATRAALRLMPEIENRRQSLYHNVRYMQNKLGALGYTITSDDSQIIPIEIGSETATLTLASCLKKNGMLAIAIRPPTVPEDTCRIRITLSSQHTKNQLDTFLDTLNTCNHD